MKITIDGNLPERLAAERHAFGRNFDRKGPSRSAVAAEEITQCASEPHCQSVCFERGYTSYFT